MAEAHDGGSRVRSQGWFESPAYSYNIFRCSLFIYSSNIEYRTLSKDDIEMLISLRQEDDGLLKDHFSMHNQLLAGSHSIARIS